MRRSGTFVVLLWLALLSLLSGCGPVRMQTDPDLVARADIMPVEGRERYSLSKAFQIGPYQVTDVVDGWSRARTESLTGKTLAESTRRYEFTVLKGMMPVWFAQTEALYSRSNTGSEELRLNLEDQKQIRTRILHPNRKLGWDLAVRYFPNENLMHGYLTGGETSWTLVSTRALANRRFPLNRTAGYHLLDGDRIIASIEVIGNGSVWIDQQVSAEHRDVIVTAAASLMIYADLDPE